ERAFLRQPGWFHQHAGVGRRRPVGGCWWPPGSMRAQDLVRHRVLPCCTPTNDTHCAPPTTAAAGSELIGGLSAFVLAATTDGTDVARIIDVPKVLVTGIARQRHLAKTLSRKTKEAHDRHDTAARL